jgi:hypothetical protein
MSSQFCDSAVNRTIQMQLDVTRSSNLVTVSFFAHLLHVPFEKRLPGLQLLFVRRCERLRLEVHLATPGVFRIEPPAFERSFLPELLRSHCMDRKHAVLDFFFQN